MVSTDVDTAGSAFKGTISLGLGRRWLNFFSFKVIFSVDEMSVVGESVVLCNSSSVVVYSLKSIVLSRGCSVWKSGSTTRDKE